MLKKLIAENLYKWEKQSFAPPAQISITPTNSCNLKCRSCWRRDELYEPNSHDLKTEMPEQKLHDIIREASELGVRCVELTGGGEPLASKAVTAQLIKEIKNRSMIGWMTSNGTLFTPDIIKLMVELEWDKLTISLDGHDAKTNDFLRPPQGNFDKIINTLRLFNEYKKSFNKFYPEITFNVVVSKYNIDNLSEIISLASKNAVRGVTFEPVKILSSECRGILVDFEKEYSRIINQLEKAQSLAHKNNIFTNIDNLIGIPELIKYSGRLLDKMPIDINATGSREAKLLGVPCIEPWFHIYLEADGNVRPCCVNPGFGENINNKSLKDIWSGEKFSSFRSQIESKNYPLSCNKCNANLICFSREIQELFKEKFLGKTIIPRIENTFPLGSTTEELRKVSQDQKKIKMLITDTASLYPPLWGGPKRIWELFGNFSQELFDMVYVGLDFGLGKGRRYNFKKIRGNFKEISCSIAPHYYLWHALEKLIFRNTSLDLFVYLWMHTDAHFKYVLNSQEADILICSHPWSSLCINKRRRQLFIYDAHNCEYLLMNQMLGKHPLKGLILRQVKIIERAACRKSDLILVCSEKEKQEFINFYKLPQEKIIIIPNGASINIDNDKIDKSVYRKNLPIGDLDKAVVFVGAYYKPNNDAVKFILENIAPKLKEYKFLVAGTASEHFKTSKVLSNVHLLGRVSEEKLDILLKAADIAINPMFDGSGINIKMLDYMSYGLPIVSTECGARGIETFGRQPMIISSADKFVDNIAMLANDRQLQEKMSCAGRSLIREHYEWKTISKGLEDTILERLKHE